MDNRVLPPAVRRLPMKRALNLFALVVATLGLAIAVTIVLKAPPAEEQLEGYVFVSNAMERNAALLKAWMVAGGATALGLFFGALAAILDRLDGIRQALAPKA